MSGHSHWAGIKHKKGLNDAKKGKVFTKHGKMITIAAQSGGNDPDTNFSLRLAIDRAKNDNMPKENIERAIKRGTGELKGNEILEFIYEAIFPGNIMMLIKTATDNKNRTVSEIKSILTKAGGKMGEIGSSAWNFEQFGIIKIKTGQGKIEETELLAIESGAQDIKIEKGIITIYTNHQDLQKVRQKLEKNNLEIIETRITFLPKNSIRIKDGDLSSYKKLLDALYEQDDVEEIYDNIKR